ncbi:Rhodanese-like domain-containing protein [Mycena pura]|uniref:Rhodanese-like domain-containing protein n=1 Tax=Mycena pura TaxID=153505 RepID=A0AAD7E329_9AGAR|nr:Rhodanese-like domain-containing protein [Mycena pura]
MQNLLVSPARLQQLLRSQTKAAVLDSTWFMPNSPRIAKAEFKAKRIPGSKFLDLDEVASPHDLGLKHMMPSQQVFSSPRALFMFKSFGHQNASILDGGLPRWEAEGYPMDINASVPTASQSTDKYPVPTLDANTIRSYEQMVFNSTLLPLKTAGAELVVDARSRGRFLGTDPEPRPGLPSGHIPNSLSLPFNVFLQNNVAPNGSSYATFLTEAKLRAAVVDAVGVEKANAVFNGELSVIASCGSGMTAAILWLGLQLMGVKKVSIYDESWTGYSLRPSSKVETCM